MLTATVLVAGFAIPACKDRKANASSDLKDAGFSMTAEDWFRACRENNVEAMKRFLTGGFSKETKDEKGNSALHAAAEADAQSAARFLLDKGMAIDSRGHGGRTPLMTAVISNKPRMVKWLLQQGADPKLKDEENFKALMLAVREGSAGSVAELAAYDREDLDSALLLAALLGKADVIDALTNYGASVYARMEDGRTPLMVAAENGHQEAVQLLLDIGASRYTTDVSGKTAALLAAEAGHPEIVGMINLEPSANELALTSPEAIAADMDSFVAAAEGEEEPVPADNTSASTLPRHSGSSSAKNKRSASKPIEGMVLGHQDGASGAHITEKNAESASPTAVRNTPPVIMRYYRETDVPIEVTGVSGDGAILRISGSKRRETTVKTGQNIPGSNSLYVLRVKRRMEDSKLSGGHPMEVAVVEVADRKSGQTREWISGRPSTAHDPIALVEDSVTGMRYTARPGQKFKSADGREFLITDVRPSQIVIEDLSDGAVETVTLVGPRG